VSECVYAGNYLCRLKAERRISDFGKDHYRHTERKVTVSLTVFGDTSICLGMADLAKHTKKVISLLTWETLSGESGRDCMGLCVI